MLIDKRLEVGGAASMRESREISQQMIDDVPLLKALLSTFIRYLCQLCRRLPGCALIRTSSR